VADRAQDPVGDRTLVGALDRAHARLHGEDALERILDADGHERHQRVQLVDGRSAIAQMIAACEPASPAARRTNSTQLITIRFVGRSMCSPGAIRDRCECER
jgi:hypothetical protein